MFNATQGSTPIDTAKKCFAENLRLFGNQLSEAEKYNLYNGLANLAIAIERLQGQISDIQVAIRRT